MTSPDDFLFGPKIPSANFSQAGNSVTGIISDLKVNQQTDLKTGELKTWPSGDPMMQLVVTLDTDQRDPDLDDDDGRRRVFVKGKRLTEATRNAVKAAGVKKLDLRGTLTVTYVRDGVPENKGINAPKEYAVTYMPPATNTTSDFLGVTQQTTQPAAAPAVTTPSPAAPNGLIGPYTSDVLAQAGITPEVAAALLNVNPAALDAMVIAGLAKAS